MYSVVLAAMLTTGSTAPAWGGSGWYNYGGCYGCRGSCHGCYGSSCYGCCGGCYGCYGCYGCCGGCYGCCGGCYGCWGMVVVQPVVYAPAHLPAAPKKPEPIPAPKKATGAPAPAQVIVQLPEQAELYVDGQRSRLTAATRTVVTPELEPGENYYYTLRAEVVRDGTAIKKDQRVLLRAGEVSRVYFRDLAPVAAAAR